MEAAQDRAIRSVEAALQVPASVADAGADSTAAWTVEDTVANGEGEGCNAKRVEGRS
jgi:hypothetical protein